MNKKWFVLAHVKGWPYKTAIASHPNSSFPKVLAGPFAHKETAKRHLARFWTKKLVAHARCYNIELNAKKIYKQRCKELGVLA